MSETQSEVERLRETVKWFMADSGYVPSERMQILDALIAKVREEEQAKVTAALCYCGVSTGGFVSHLPDCPMWRLKR